MKNALWRCRRILFCFFLAVGFLAAAQPASAQQEWPPYPYTPCGEDPSDCPFALPLRLNTFTLPSGCQVEVAWQARTCGTNYDLTIVGIRFLSGCSSTLTLPSALNQVIGVMLEANLMNFPPVVGTAPEGSCVTTYRVLRSGCWSDHRGAVSPSPYAYACNAGCCRRSYTVCIQNGQRVVTPTGGTGEACPANTTDPYGFPCQPVCGQ